MPTFDGEDGRSWLEENLPDPAAGPDAAYARSVLLGSIQAALQTLPAEQRDVFVAHEIEGASFADLSARWLVPMNTLLARKRYAVHALRARLRAEYGTSSHSARACHVWRKPCESFRSSSSSSACSGCSKHFGLVDPAFLHLLWPLLLIGIGVAMLARGPRWRADMRERMHAGTSHAPTLRPRPGELSEEERERFRAGMRQWKSRVHAEGCGHSSTPASDGTGPKSSARPPSPGEHR